MSYVIFSLFFHVYANARNNMIIVLCDFINRSSIYMNSYMVASDTTNKIHKKLSDWVGHMPIHSDNKPIT